jgi:hypothetical protein
MRLHESELVDGQRTGGNRPKAAQRTSEQVLADSPSDFRHLHPAAILQLQKLIGNQSVGALLAGHREPIGHTSLVVSRQPDDESPEETPQYPPDWQHGAPTRPVPPDPHVWEQPGPARPPDRGPYRTPGQQSPGDPSQSGSPTTRERIADALQKAGVPAWAVAAVVTLVVAALVDPEPFSKVALLIGVAAATAFFVLIGRRDSVPSGATASAVDGSDNQQSVPADGDVSEQGSDYSVA